MANAKTGKKVIRRRREKKNVEKGQVQYLAFPETKPNVIDGSL